MMMMISTAAFYPPLPHAINTMARALIVRYSVPIAITTGYGDEKTIEELTKTRKTTRFAPETIFHHDTYGQPYRGIPVL